MENLECQKLFKEELANRGREFYRCLIVLCKDYLSRDPEIKEYVEQGLISLDYVILEEVVYRYFRDVYRIKCFHPYIKLENEYKVAGYITHKICKYKPIVANQYAIKKQNKKNLDQKILNINEIFALYFSLALVSQVIEARILSLVGKRFEDHAFRLNVNNGENFIESFDAVLETDKGFVTELLYTLKNRNMTGFDYTLLYQFFVKGIEFGFYKGFKSHVNEC